MINTPVPCAPHDRSHMRQKSREGRLSMKPAIWIACPALLARAPETVRADGMLRDFAYPHPVKWFAFTSQGQPLEMAYMDVPPAGAPNGRSIVFFHGKNFCAATWE